MAFAGLTAAGLATGFAGLMFSAPTLVSTIAVMCLYKMVDGQFTVSARN